MKFYVYEHWRPDLDVCFYVGKGWGGRANDMRRSRNLHHRGVQKKLASLGMCVEVRMVASQLSEAEALRIECERIAFWLSANVRLANQTAGGDGLRSPSQETRRKISAAASRAMKGRKKSPEHVANARAAMMEAQKKNPEIIEKIRAAAKAQWADPEKRARLLEGLQNQKPSEKRSTAMRARMAKDAIE